MNIKCLVKTVINLTKGQSDIDRWKDPASLKGSEEKRTQLLSTFINEDTKELIEFGCGLQHLKSYLRKDIKYTPSDIVDRGGCVVCDLNLGIPELDQYDTVFLSGVMEYVNSIPQLAEDITSQKSIKTIIMSYPPKNKNRIRLSKGWVNDYSRKEFERIFLIKGFRITESELWKCQNLYKFERNV